MRKVRFLITLLVMTMFFAGTVSATEIKMANGWSTAATEQAAVAETAQKMSKVVSNPNFTVLYSTVGYDVKKVLSEYKAKYPGSKVFGMTSFKGILSNDGFHVGDVGSLALMGFEGVNVGVGADGFVDTTPANIKLSVDRAITEAVKNAGKTSADKPDLIYVAMVAGTEETTLDQIQKTLGRNIPIYGGTAADNDMSGKWAVFANNEVYNSGVSVALFYNTKQGGSFQTGFLASKTSGIVTSAEGRHLKTIDGRPAGVVFNEWAKNKYATQLAEGAAIAFEPQVTTLARTIKIKAKEELLFTAPLNFVKEDKSLMLAANVMNGDKIYFIEGNRKSLINRMGPIITKALIGGRIIKANMVGGLNIYCCGAFTSVGDQYPELIAKINTSMGNKPWVGPLTFGETGYYKGWGSLHGSVMSSMVLFSK